MTGRDPADAARDSAALRELAESGDRPAFLAELDRQMTAWQDRIDSGTPEGNAERAQFVAAMQADPLSRDGCPDGGACHHGCARGCFRVRYASPLSAAGWGETWPAEIRDAYGETDGVL